MEGVRTRHALQALGADVSWKVNRETDYIISRDKTTIEHLEAKIRGLPILDELDLEKLLEGEEVSYEEEREQTYKASFKKGMQELIGEVRSAAQGEPTPEKWVALLRLLDRCRDEDLELMADYIDAHTSRWSASSMRDFTGHAAKLSDPHDATNPENKYRRYFPHLGIRGELRVAPQEWVDQLQQGVESPKFKIIRALDFVREKQRTGAGIAKVLKHPELSRIETVRVSSYVIMSKGIIEALVRLPKLTRLTIGKINLKTAEAFEAASKNAVCELRDLDISEFEYPKKLKEIRDIYAFTKAALFDKVETLYIANKDESLELLTALNKNKALLAVNHIHLEGNYTTAPFLKKMLSHKLFKTRFDKLGAAHMFYLPRKREQWVDLFAYTPRARLGLLDLSGFANDPTSHTDEPDRETLEMLGELLPTSKLLAQVDHLVIGSWKTPELLDALATHHPHLAVS